MKIKMNLALLAISCLAIGGCDKDNDDHQTPSKDAETFLAAGDSAAIVSKINGFRERAGNPLNVSPGAKSGRREVNWDAVPADLTNKNTFPADFFGATDAALPDTRKRGILFTPAAAALRVSDNNLADIDPAYGGQFKALSKSKIFTSAGSNITEFKFQVPGTGNAAYVTAFGVVFTDVDNNDATRVDVYEGNTLIASAKAPAADKKYSFVGIAVKNHKITRVKITSGNKAIAPGITDGAATDLVAMDDFIYSEPQAN